MLYFHMICYEMSFASGKVGNTWLKMFPESNTDSFKSRLRSGEIQTWKAGKAVLMALKVLSVASGDEGLLEITSMFQNIISVAVSALAFNLLWYWGE